MVDWEFRVPGAIETVEVTRFIEGEQISFVFSDGKAVHMHDEHTQIQTTQGVSGPHMNLARRARSTGEIWNAQ